MQSTETLDALKDIRNMMQRSSRFISLSGLSGVFSGIFALIGAYAAWWRTHSTEWIIREAHTDFGTGRIVQFDPSVVWFLVADALIVLALSLAVSYYFTRKKARQHGLPLWGPYSRHMLLNLSLPLLTGALVCAIFFHHGLIALIAPCTLIFYGLSLLNAGKYSFEEVSYLGLTEVILGILALWFKGMGLLFWGAGFGVLHIVYGILMYFRHDR